MQISCDDVAGDARCALSYRSATRRVAYRLAPSCRVVTSTSLACVWFTVQCGTVALYCSGESTRLTGHDYVTYMCVSQAPRYACALLNNVPLLFSYCSQILIYSSHGRWPCDIWRCRSLASGEVWSRATRHVTASESSLAERRV
jgi:hypothetical protein